MGGSKRIIVALIAASIAVVLVLSYGWAARRDNSSAYAGIARAYKDAVTEVYIAKADIPPGTTLDGSLLERVRWPSILLPANAVTKPQQFDNKSAKMLIQRNEPLSQARISSDQNGFQVPEGYAALTIPSDDVRSVGGAIATGSCVNLYSVVDSKASLLDGGVRVIETSAYSQEVRSSSEREPVSWVTLAVREEKVEEILASSKTGSLYLTLPALEGASHG